MKLFRRIIVALCVVLFLGTAYIGVMMVLEYSHTSTSAQSHLIKSAHTVKFDEVQPTVKNQEEQENSTEDTQRDAVLIGDNIARVNLGEISATAAVVIEANSGKILYAKNENVRRSMASTTKVMTSLLAADEMEKENKEIKVTYDMVNVEGSSMGLLPDDVVDLEMLIAGMLLPSGNDAANVTACVLGGSLEEFAKMMNARAKEIGMENTNFVTPSGLDDDMHYTTAYDMALLSACAMNNEHIKEIAQTKSMKITTMGTNREIWLSNHNKLLDRYEYCIGLKTGYTMKSGRCLVSAAQKDGIMLIAVTLEAPDDWNDHIKMYESCFNQIETLEDSRNNDYEVNVVGSYAEKVKVSVENQGLLAKSKNSDDVIEKKIELPEMVYAPIQKGDELGRVYYMLNGEEVYSQPLIAQENVYQNFVPKDEQKEKGMFDDVGEFFENLFSKTRKE